MTVTTLSSVHYRVRTAMRKRLATMAGYPGQDAVSWEGVPFQPPAAVTAQWLREVLSPASSQLQTLGPKGRIRHGGVYLVDVFSPAGKGGRNADTLAGGVMEVFPPNLMLTQDDLTITIEAVYRSKTVITAEWLQVPVTVQWRTHTFNTI